MRDHKKVINELRADGWHVEKRRRSGHWVARHPQATALLFMPGTPSDRRAVANIRAQARRLRKETA
jgi:predicted RNA binding protein YcfA (HicA-like mRNA interferase family)